jgi:hypothetical protein
MQAPESDPDDLRHMGWGLVTPSNLAPEIRGALAPLLAMRQQQSTQLYKEIEYRPGESASSFLSRHGLSASTIEPSRVPYYLLIAGRPQQIPFSFQQQLDVSLAVGRVHFDRIEDYARYAESVVAAESSGPPQARELVLFAPRHHDDAHSATLAQLVAQLGEETLRASDWRTTTLAGPDALKNALRETLHRPPAPAIMLAAAHTIHFAEESFERHFDEGALVCGDWGGVGTPPDRTHILAARDVPLVDAPRGTVSILWGSNTVGSDEPHSAPIVTALAQRLLGGASGLAVVGLAGRMLGLSLGLGDPSPRQALTLAIRAMTQGRRVGHAMQAVSDTVAALSSELSDALEQARFGRELDATRLIHTFLTRADLRHVVTLGDPAVRVPAAIAGRPA